MSSNDFNGPDWPARGRRASNNAGGGAYGADSGYGAGDGYDGYDESYPGQDAFGGQPFEGQRSAHGRQPRAYAGQTGAYGGRRGGHAGGREEYADPPTERYTGVGARQGGQAGYAGDGYAGGAAAAGDELSPGNYRTNFRRGFDRMTGPFRGASEQFSGPLRAVSEQLSGPLQAVTERVSGSFRSAGDRITTRGGTRAPGIASPRRRSPGGPGGPGTRGPRGARVKRKGDWWRRWTWKKALAVAAGGFGGIILIAFLSFVYEYNTTPIPTQTVADATAQDSTAYYSDGTTPIGTFGTVNRQLLTYNQIPKDVRDAIMAAEDRGFMTEGAISFTGILRAAWDDLTGNSTSLSGGSTITQEFVRHYYNGIGTQQTISRKIKEIIVAEKVSKSKPKWWILQNYLNTIDFGEGAHGIDAAAETYYHVPASKLTVAQAAVLAAIVQLPSEYPLPQYRPQLIARWHYVLTGMVTMGDLTAQQAAALKFPVPGDTPLQSVGADPWDPYILDVVASEAQAYDGINQNQLDNGGLKIVTTISRPMEQELYNAVNQNVRLMKAGGGALPSYAMIGAELQNPSNGQMIAMYPGVGQNMSKAKCDQLDCDLNTALTREQVGSSFKPYVLSTAVSQGMNVKTSQLDGYGPTLYIPPDSMPNTPATTDKKKAQSNWYPVHNDAHASYGPMSVQNAFSQSSNTAFTDLIHKVGTKNVVNMAQEMGVNVSSYANGGSNLVNDEGHVGMALGQDSLTVNEQDTMLATIANGGTYHQAHIVKSITFPGGTPMPAKYSTTVGVLSQPQASQVQYAMSTVTVNGTAAGEGMTDGRPVIAKTGTTQTAQSAFFIGAIPQYALTVAIFTQEQNSGSTETLNDLGGTTAGGFGGYWPAKIWHTFAEAEFAKLPPEKFLTPQFSGQKWVMATAKKKKSNKPPANCLGTDGQGNCYAYSQQQGPTSTCYQTDGNGNCVAWSPAASPSPGTPNGNNPGGGNSPNGGIGQSVAATEVTTRQPRAKPKLAPRPVR